MHVPVLAAVGLSQVIQVPISAFATVGNVVYGEIDVATAAALSVLLMIGVWFGARIAHRVSSVALKRFVSLMLLGGGGDDACQGRDECRRRPGRMRGRMGCGFEGGSAHGSSMHRIGRRRHPPSIPPRG